MKTLHVHIGTPKTGTTSIQNFCVENQDILERQGYCYPLFPYSYKKVSKNRNGHFLFGKAEDAEGKRDREKEAAICQEGMQTLQKLFETHDHIILSDEDIWRSMDDTKKTFWTDLKQMTGSWGIRIHVIVYLRRQDKYFISNWNQNVKLRIGKFSEKRFADFFAHVNREVRLDYYGKLERMAGIIGKDNITVRRFDGGNFKGGSIYADFLQAVGLMMTEEYVLPEKILNIGLYGNTHEIKRILNGLPQMEKRPINKFFIERLQECSELSGRQYPSDMMTKEEIAAFLADYKLGNQKIAEEYLGDPDADLFDPAIKDLPKWQEDNPYWQDDLIRYIGVTAAELFFENRELKQELERLSDTVADTKHLSQKVRGYIKRKSGKK